MNPFTLRATGSASGIDAAQVRRSLSLLADPEFQIELRGLPSGRSFVRRGDDIDGLVEAAEALSDDKGVYYLLNPVAFTEDRAAKVGDVLGRRWLLVDIDPRRPKDSNSTAAEHEAGQQAALKITLWLDQQGWPLPLLIDSGNGWHLLYRIELENDKEAQALLKRVLVALGDRFDSDAIEVDRKVHNASRISKLPGTWARKGPHSAERPHRMCRLVNAPEPLEVVSLAALEVVAGPEGKTVAPNPFRLKVTDGGGLGAWARKALQLETANVALAPSGGRNDQLFRSTASLAGLIPHHLLTEVEVREAMTRAAAGAGLGEAETQKTVESGIAAGMASPRELPADRDETTVTVQAEPCPPEWEEIIPITGDPDVACFPLDTFPDALQAFCGEVAWATNCPLDFGAVSLLGMAAGAIGNTRRLAITRSHQQSAVLYTCIVGLPGTGKSPAFDAVKAPFEAIENKWLAAWRIQKEAYDASTDDNVQPPPPPRRLLADDATGEALVALLAANPRGLLMARDEISALAYGMNQYKPGGKGSERQTYLTLWSQGTIKSDRKGNADGVPVRAYKPFLAISGGIQPGVVQCLRGDPGKRGEQPPDDGFVDRFLFSWPVTPPHQEETWREISEEAESAWSRCVGKLLDLPLTIEGGIPKPQVLYLTEDGRDAWLQFTRAHAAELNDPDFEEHLSGAWSKLRGYCARIAVVLHTLKEVSGEPIRVGLVDGPTVESAARLVAYFKSHLRKVLLMANADPVVAKCRRVLKWIDRKGVRQFKRRELFMGVKSLANFPRPDSLDGPLQRLVRHNYLRVVKPADGGQKGAGRPESEVYEVNPLLDPQNPQNPQNSGFLAD